MDKGSKFKILKKDLGLKDGLGTIGTYPFSHFTPLSLRSLQPPAPSCLELSLEFDVYGIISLSIVERFKGFSIFVTMRTLIDIDGYYVIYNAKF